jgi:hypothetical protein
MLNKCKCGGEAKVQRNHLIKKIICRACDKRIIGHPYSRIRDLWNGVGSTEPQAYITLDDKGIRVEIMEEAKCEP